MMMEEMEGKRWQELLLIQLKKTLNIQEQFKLIIDKLEDLNYSLDLDELEEYVSAIDKKIHIPIWNKYPETNPDQLNVYVEKYYVFFEPDFFHEARWENGNFILYNEYRESGNGWEIETDMKFWLPIIYPTPY